MIDKLNSEQTNQLTEYTLLKFHEINLPTVYLFTVLMDLEHVDLTQACDILKISLSYPERIVLSVIIALCDYGTRVTYFNAWRVKVLREVFKAQVLVPNFLTNIESQFSSCFDPVKLRPFSLSLFTNALDQAKRISKEGKCLRLPILDLKFAVSNVKAHEKQALRLRHALLLTKILAHHLYLQTKCQNLRTKIKQKSFQSFLKTLESKNKHYNYPQIKLKSISLVPMVQKHRQIQATDQVIISAHRTKILETVFAKSQSMPHIGSASSILMFLDGCILKNRMDTKSKRLALQIYKKNNRKFMHFVFNYTTKLDSTKTNCCKNQRFSFKILNKMITFSKSLPRSSNAKALLTSMISQSHRLNHQLNITKTDSLTTQLPFSVVVLHKMLNFKNVHYPNIKRIDPADLLRERTYYLYGLLAKLESLKTEVDRPTNRLAYAILKFYLSYALQSPQTHSP